MKVEELFDFLNKHQIWEDLIIYVRDNDTNEIHNELLLTGETYGDWEWNNDWYEGQDYTIIGHIKVSKVTQI